MIDRTDLYEITLILSEDGDISKLEKIISFDAEIKKSTDLQIKQFAYPIGKLTSGHYYAVEFVAETDKVQKIDFELKGEKEIIRFLITKALRKNPEPIRTGEYAKKPEAGENKELRIKNKESEAKATETIAIKQEPITIEAPTKTTEEPGALPVDPAEEKVEAEEVPKEAVGKVEIEVPTNEVVGIPTESVGKPKVDAKPEEKLVVKKPRTTIKRPKAEKVSAEELDKKLEELVKE